MQLEFPNSFQMMDETSQWFTLFPNFVYFSFVTITILGVGDISPTLPVAQFSIYLEAIIGQFYLAVLVASLVGSRMSTLPHKS